MSDPARPGLAARVVDLACTTPIGPTELAQAQLAVLDTLAAGLAGGDEPAPRLVRRSIAQPAATGPTVWHDRVRTPLNDTVLANAVAAHALDYDCLIPSAFVQPGAVLIPGLIAVAERDGRSGAALTTAVCRGVAVLGALGVAYGGDLHTAGWHPTTVLGVVATAAATACLLELDRAEIATAVNIAVALSGGLKRSFGTMTKELQVGEAARSGVWAAVLAADGMSAAPDAADSWLRLVAGGSVAIDLPQQRPALHLKRYPCCGRMHAALDVAVTLRADLAGDTPRADELREITCALNPRDISHIDRDAVHSAAEAKFSVQYGLAATLLRGALALADFDVVGDPDPEVFALMGRVRIAADSRVPSFGAAVAITSSSGHTVRGRAEAPTAASPTDVATKFVDCARWAGLAVEDAERFTGLVASLDDLADVRELIHALPATAETIADADGPPTNGHRSPLEGITS